jgi:hypothetical protein
VPKNAKYSIKNGNIKMLMVLQHIEAESVSPMPKVRMSLGNNSPINNWRLGKTPVECAVKMQVTKKSGSHPSPSKKDESSDWVLMYENVANEISARMTTAKQVMKSTLVEARLIAMLDIIAERTWLKKTHISNFSKVY